MSHNSPLRTAQPNALSICGKILLQGQTLTVPATAIGPRERKAEEKGKISIRPSNKEGQVQIVCLLER